MGSLFKSLSAGFSRFVLAWLVPSVVTLAVFAIFVYPDISSSVPLRPLARLTGSAVSTSIVFIFSALLLGLLFSLASRPTYRVLEGYQLPRAMKRWLLRRQIRTWLVLRHRYNRTPARLRAEREMLRERLGDYPRRRENLLPTRLGNAFKTMETFGVDQYRLDSQTFWYELNALAPDRARQDADDARASVDFFISFLAHLALLSVVSLVVAATAQSTSALIVGLTSGALIKFAYDAAVRNMTDWRYAVQALVPHQATLTL